MIEDDFYATVKLKTGEEIFAKVAPSDENGETLLLITNPVTVSEVKTRSGTGYKLEQWLKTSKEDIFILNMNDILTLSESKNIQMISMYQSYIRNTTDFSNSSGTRRKINRKMGYISNINDAKEILEKLFNNS
jgi:hypothetical protein